MQEVNFVSHCQVLPVLTLSSPESLLFVKVLHEGTERQDESFFANEVKEQIPFDVSLSASQEGLIFSFEKVPFEQSKAESRHASEKVKNWKRVMNLVDDWLKYLSSDTFGTFLIFATYFQFSLVVPVKKSESK